MSGLSEKAKTFGEIRDWLKEVGDKVPYDHEEFKKRQKTKWVRLEGAQQEIGLANEELKRARIMLEDANMERGLQKQKLQRMLKLWDNQWHLGIVLQETDWLLGEFGQLRKLELLRK